MTLAKAENSEAIAGKSRNRFDSLSNCLTAIEASSTLQFIVLIAIAFAVRASVFGDWTYHTDEEFYSVAAQRMLEGKLLYVDIWDRKGPVLFLIYAACALISSSVLSYQIAATISAALGAFLITRLAARLTEVRYALLAGIAYYGLLAHFGGGGGQSPVFYNTLMLHAAYAIGSSLDRLRDGQVPPRVYFGIFCAGLAMAVKATAAIEGIFFGLVILWLLWRSNCTKPRLLARVVGLAIIALAPYLITFLYFTWLGHFGTVWNALVLSNFNRAYETLYERMWRSGVMLGSLAPILAFAAIGWHLSMLTRGRSLLTLFLGCWAAVAMAAVLIFPNIYLHYGLPVAGASCILAARYFARGLIGLAAFAVLSIYNFAVGGQFDLAFRQDALRSGTELASYVRSETPNRKLFVYSSANYLYALTDAPLLSRIAFAHHFFDDAESGVTGMDEHRELRRVLESRPETVVYEANLDYWTPQNLVNNEAVRRYLRSCRKKRSIVIHTFEEPQQEQRVYSRCGGN
ncbi:ArnT family glycosyltransferase [Novosphingobium sp. YAF33]|uniref:ArnT family glycosyltransferase n=1 Tax=Novosphingobium sp. YAF33 TaxID=3233082 RepID=UPI003F9E199B